MTHIVMAAIGCLLVAGCASREDRTWRNLQTILEIQDTR